MEPENSPPRVLLFSKTAGYRHESIPASIKALTEFARTSGSLSVDATEDAALINPANLARYSAIVFLQTSGNFLDDTQFAALKGYVRSGGGFVGIHSAAGGMRTHPWYGDLIGAVFTDHPKPQDGVIKVEDTDHVTTAGLQANWEWHDEWYNFKANPRSKVHVLMSIDEGCYEGGTMGHDHPLAWYHEFEGARSFYTSLGHFDKAWEDEAFLGHVYNGILWAASLA